MKLEEKKYIADLFKARFPFLYIASWEENRIIESISDIVAEADLIHTKRNVYVWGVTTGLSYTKFHINTLNHKSSDQNDRCSFLS